MSDLPCEDVGFYQSPCYTLVMGLWINPHCFSRYRDLVAIPKDTLIMIFAAAKIIVLMPQLVENVKELFRKYDLEDDKVESGAEVLMPLAYPFPNLGTYTILMFIPFSAWYIGRSLDVSDQLMFQAASLMSSFVAPIIGIPFLLDLLRIPADMMELFMMSTVYTDRIRVVLGAVHLLSLTVVVLAIRRGVFAWNTAAVLRASGISVLAVVIALVSVRAYLDRTIDESYTGDQALVQMRWMDRTVPVKSFRTSLPKPEAGAGHTPRLDVIAARGTLRVGYTPDALPFAFANERGEIVGFDIELAHRLASDLGVTLELVRIGYQDITRAFEGGHIDIVMSGLAVTVQRALQWKFSASPLDLTMGFLVADHRRKEFLSLESVKKIPDLKLGIVQSDTALQRLIDAELTNAELATVPSPREFLRGNLPELDAVVYSAEGGSAWTLIYPAYTVVVPRPGVIKLPMAYPLPRGQDEWAEYVSEWVRIKQKEGTISGLFDHWIKGRGAEDLAPRWSVIRDVLHWVK
jgi:ABC-type amino acid transport substrate-binding protein